MGATVRAWGEMYKAVAQLGLLYYRKSWVVTGEMLKVLAGLHHQAVQRIMAMMVKRGEGG